MPSSTPTLRDMVQDALDRGQTYKQLAERAVDPETSQRASPALLNDIVRGNVTRAPTVAHLRAIAAALAKPYEAVRRAAIAQWLPADEAEDPDGDLRDQVQQLSELTARLLDKVGEDPAE